MLLHRRYKSFETKGLEIWVTVGLPFLPCPRYRYLVLLIRNQSKSVNHTCDQNMTSAKKQPYVNPRIRGISGDDEKEVLRKLQLLCRYDSGKRLQTNGRKQLGRHYKN
ncbi:unnamed protein product [Schistosoma guineensis]|nr:unnamed protein product [Schistosoma guineensis]